MEENENCGISEIVLKEIKTNIDKSSSGKKFKHIMKKNNSLDQLPIIKIKRSQFCQLSSRKWIKNDIITQKRQIEEQRQFIKKSKKSIYNKQFSIDSINANHKNYELQTIQQNQELQRLKKKNQFFALLLNKKKNLDRMKLNVIIRQALNDLIQRRQKLLNPLQQNQLIYSINY